MGHHNLQHTEPLKKQKHHSHGTIPANVYGALTGTFDHWTLSAHNGTHADDNHIYLWLVSGGGKFEAAVNVESSKIVGDASPDKRELSYSLHDETVPMDQWPAIGFSGNASLSYAALGLHEADFTIVTSGALRTLIATDAMHAQRISVYGMTYTEGTGIHDVHMNTGGKDGALIFYFDEQHGGPKARWVFLKFANQVLA